MGWWIYEVHWVFMMGMCMNRFGSVHKRNLLTGLRFHLVIRYAMTRYPV